MNGLKVYLAALLHDIGKPIERTKYFQLEQNSAYKQLDTNYVHPKYPNMLFAEMKKEVNKLSAFWTDVLNDDFIDMVTYHHNPKKDEHKIVQLADWLSSAERNEDENSKGQYNTIPLGSLFTEISLLNCRGQEEQHKNEDKYSYKLGSLISGDIFPKKNITINASEYKAHIKDFLDKLKMIKNKEMLLFHLENYLWCVPAQTIGYVPNISLFDHLKTTAAIALCLWHDIENKSITYTDIDKILKSHLEVDDKYPFLLVCGDLSGIQKFIFNIPSKGAAESLKERSFYLSLLQNIIAEYIITELGLEKANILYSSGGRFYLLVPVCYEDRLIKTREHVLKTLLNAHNADLYMGIVWDKLSPKDFLNIGEKWSGLNILMNKQKGKKWSEINLADKFESIFQPQQDAVTMDHCRICGRSGKNQGNGNCDFCDSLIELAGNIKKNKYVVNKLNGSIEAINTINHYQDVFKLLGRQVNFSNNADEFSYTLYGKENYDYNSNGILFGVFSLPEGDFDDLAKRSTGDKKIASLKLDVDNLGKIFSSGFKKISISKISTLSRMLDMFFQMSINDIIKDNNWNDNLYVVFSGGDDCFIIGSYNIVIEFAKVFRDEFREYTANNSEITFSAGVNIFDPHFPVYRMCHLAEKSLDDAKLFKWQDENKPGKDKITFLGEVFSWEEFGFLLQIKKVLLELGENIQKRSFFQKVLKSTAGFKKILEESQKGRFCPEKIWRLRYYLKDIGDNDKKEQLAKIYENIVLHNMFKNEKVRNIMIVPAATRYAELLTKSKKEG